MTDAIFGMTMETLAEALTKHGELRAKFGEKQGEAEFDAWLRSQGHSLHSWSNAHNAWHERWKADPTGMQQAKFHQLLAKMSAKAHYGDVRDMTQDQEEGVTLDKYAEIVVAVGRGGAGVDDIVRRFGLQNADHWQRAQAAWNKRMSEDTTHKLTMQYGELYSKHAGPSHQQEMLQATAGFLAQANGPQDVVDEPEEELTPELCLQKMESRKQSERWKYARHYAHMIDLGNVPDKAWAINKVHPILIEMLERWDEHTTSDAAAASRKLWDIGCRDEEFQSSLRRCLNVATERLATLQAAFAPIQNQAVPERITLQQRIEDHKSLIDDSNEILNDDWTSGDWRAEHGGGGGGAAFAPTQQQAAMPFQPSPSSPQMMHGHQSQPQWGGHGSQPNLGNSMPAVAMGGMPNVGGGIPKWLIAPVAVVLVGGALFATVGRSMMAKKHHDTTTASSAAAVGTNATAAKVNGASQPPAAAVETPPAAAAASSAAPAPAAPAKAKGKAKKK